jgi:hypothetical protein
MAAVFHHRRRIGHVFGEMLLKLKCPPAQSLQLSGSAMQSRLERFVNGALQQKRGGAQGRDAA